MLDDIRSEFVLDITFMVKTIAGLWPTIKLQRPTNDSMIAGQLLVAQADDLLHPIIDWETPARAAGWAPSDKFPGALEKEGGYRETTWEAACSRGDTAAVIHDASSVYIIDPQLFAQLAVMDEHRLDQNFGGWPVWATWRNEEQLKEFLNVLVHRRQQEIWQDAIKRAKQRFHFTEPQAPLPYFGRTPRWDSPNYGEAQADIARETS
jgi:hypothetical protein